MLNILYRMYFDTDFVFSDGNSDHLSITEAQISSVQQQNMRTPLFMWLKLIEQTFSDLISH